MAPVKPRPSENIGNLNPRARRHELRQLDLQCVTSTFVLKGIGSYKLARFCEAVRTVPQANHAELGMGSEAAQSMTES